MWTDLITNPRIYATPEDDARQDVEVGDFRARSLLMAGRDKTILEIGAGYSPLFRKAEGYNVRIVDHLPTEQLVEKYRQLGVDTSRIEQVDYVYTGQSIPEMVGGQKFDVVYASHVVEHATDFVGFLQGSLDVLTPEGVIILLVPDKRYCFDFFQPLTDSAKVLSDHVAKARRHSFESLYREEMQVMAEHGGEERERFGPEPRLAWWQGAVADIHLFRHDPQARFASVLAQARSSEYVDAHEYFFIPSTFQLVVEEMNFLGVLPLRLALLTRSRGCEFMAVLTRAPLGRMSRDEFLATKKMLAVRSIKEQMEAFGRFQEDGRA